MLRLPFPARIRSLWTVLALAVALAFGGSSDAPNAVPQAQRAAMDVGVGGTTVQHGAPTGHGVRSAHGNGGAAQPPRILLIIGIPSAPGHVEHRNLIRRTWGAAENLPPDVELKFILGDKAAVGGAEAEAASVADGASDDIVWVPVKEGYRNVILKLMYFCAWAQQHRNFAYLMKADDNTYLWLQPLRRALLGIWRRQARNRARASAHAGISAGVGSGDIGEGQGGDDLGGGLFDDGAGFIPSPDLARPRGVYYGHIWTGPPIRDPRAKNFLPAERYPLPLYAPYAHGAAYALSADYVNFVVQNHVQLSDGLLGNCPHCGAHEDSQIGLWLHALGARPVHEGRFNDLTHCNRDSIALFDVPNSLMGAVHAAARAAEAERAAAVRVERALWQQRRQQRALRTEHRRAAAQASGQREDLAFAEEERVEDERERAEKLAAKSRLEDVRLAHSFCSDGVRRASIAEYRRLTDANPADGRNHNNIGLHLLLLHAYGEAVGAFEAAVRAEPGAAEPANNLAFARGRAALVAEGRCAPDSSCRLEVSRACDAGLRAISARVAVPHFTDPNSPGYAPFNAFLTLAVDAGAA